jgi:hypothetical protein
MDYRKWTIEKQISIYTTNKINYRKNYSDFISVFHFVWDISKKGYVWM